MPSVLATAAIAIQLVVGLVLSLVAGLLLKPKAKSPVQDDAPSSTSLRGSYVPIVHGIRRVGAVIAWVGDRAITKESSGGGGKGGGSSGKVQVYHEGGWHLLCVGPAWALHRIWESGKIIWEGPITRDSHPSGSTIDVGDNGSFDIYWGEPDQPTNSYLDTNIGILSRWPFHCYVLWNRKRLGSGANWPVIDYEIESRPEESGLSESAAVVDPTSSAAGAPINVLEATDGAAGVASIRVSKRKTDLFRSGQKLALSGNAAAAGDYEILYSTYDGSRGTYTPSFPTWIFVPNPDYNTTLIVLNTALSGSDDNGTVDPYDYELDGGVNAAHVLYQLLFATHPHGMGVDTELFDIDSLEDVGVALAAEGVYINIAATEGEELEAILGVILQDMGILISWDVTQGVYRFVLNREATGQVPYLSNDMLLDLQPEQETVHGPFQFDKLVFKFPDRTVNFKDMTINIDDDGRADHELHVKSREISLPTITNFAVGSVVSERRSQEELGSLAVLKIKAGRQARWLWPGDVIELEALPFLVRILEKEIDPLTSKVVLSVAPDFYGTAASTFSNTYPTLAAKVTEVEQDIFSAIEVPESLAPYQTMQLWVPHIRGNSLSDESDIWISQDDTTYEQVGTQRDMHQGGYLTSELAASDPYVIENGPTFDAEGPDIAEVEDYSSDETNWHLGRQVALIGEELFYLRNITALGGNSYRLDGLIRARWGTQRALHEIGDSVIIFKRSEILVIEDLLLQPQTILFVKSQPKGGSSIPLDEIPQFPLSLNGNGIVPRAPTGLRTANHLNGYFTGQDPELRWMYFSPLVPGTGAGQQGAGTPVSESPVQGTFVMEFYTTGDVLKKTVTGLTEPTYTYDNADLVSDFGSEVSFKVKVKNVNGAYSSDYAEVTVEAL